MSTPVTIDFISDVVCPWCALGATALEQAIDNLAGEVKVELTFKPFELNPDMPAEGENAVAHMMRKYGRSAEEVASGKRMLMERGDAIGFTFTWKNAATSTTPSTPIGCCFGRCSKGARPS